MTKGSRNKISMYLGVALLAAGSVFAGSTDTIRATVPFEFMIGKRTIPAGDYTIRKAGVLDALALRSADDRLAEVFLTNSTRRTEASREETKLVFHRYGNRNFLREIWVVGELSGHQLPPSAAEREASMTAGRQRAPDKVIVLAAR